MPPGNPDPSTSASRRRYEEAVLAALDFEPDDDPFAPPPARRSRRAVLELLGLAVAHVFFAVLVAEALARGVGGLPLLIVTVGWATCTVLIARRVFRAGRRLLRGAG